MRSLSIFLALALALFILTGCEDPEARSNALAAKQDADELKGKVTQLQDKLEKVTAKVDTLRESLNQAVADKLDPIAKGLTGLEEKLRGEITKARTENMDEMTKALKVAREDFDNRLNNALTTRVAEDVAKLREEMKTQRNELIGFMDKQLKELYPYAYQPKRLESTGQPEVK